ncbi:hypothetical protein [Streptomyces sp. NPDC060366]|uniref:hypothetical protein n=1 Tax=Streptomyces sp. NPDC060366 TaxID=3347105 RepID=UPI003666546C
MVTTRTRTHRLLCAAVAGSLTFLAAGCSDDTGKEPPDVYVTADKLCGGRAVTKDAAKALQVITGDTRFAASGKYSTVADAVEELTDKATYRNYELGDICRIYPDDSANELRIRWELMSTAPKGPSAQRFTTLPMGEDAGATHDMAYVTFACGHKDQPNSSPDYISASAEATVRTRPEGDERRKKNAYATLAHSFALAMVKELKCDDNAGLKPEPSLIPAT